MTGITRPVHRLTLPWPARRCERGLWLDVEFDTTTERITR